MSHEALEEVRVRAVQCVLAGESPEQVIKSLGMTRGCIYKWLSAYSHGGLDALKAKKLHGRPTTLLPKHLKWIFKVVRRDPRQLYFDFALWTSRMVRTALCREFGIELSKATMCRVLKSLGLSPQRPLHRAWQQNPQVVQKWLDEDFPQVKELAKKMNANIFFGDEAGVQSTSHSGTTWAPVGETPVVKTTGARFGLNMISAVSARGDMRFMISDHSIKALDFVKFLQRLIWKANKPIFLIVDNLPLHKSKAVKTFEETNKDIFRLFRLPPYSPELNPDELVWNELKGKVGRLSPKTKEELKTRTHQFLREIQNNTEKVSSYFQEKSVKYAA